MSIATVNEAGKARVGKATLTAQQRKNRALLATAHDFVESYTPTCWLEANPTATLLQLKERLEEAIDECISFGDELISDHEGNIGESLQDELDVWRPSEDECDLTFSRHREEKLAEFYEQIEGLIELFGDDFQVSDLVPDSRKWTEVKKAAIEVEFALLAWQTHHGKAMSVAPLSPLAL